MDHLVAKRSLLRIGVRGLLALILILGCVMGWVVNRARVQRDAVAVIKHVGGEVAYSWQWSDGLPVQPRPRPPGPDWVRKWLGPDYVEMATFVRLMNNLRFDDKVMREACRLPSLEELWVVNTAVTDEGAEELHRLRNLRVLDLRLNRISSRPLRHIGEMTKLRELKLAMRLSPIPLRDGDMAFLKRLTKLERLMLPSDQLTDDWLVYIEDLTNLSYLQLYDMAITTKGLEHLDGLSNLRVLTLHGTRITSLEPLRPLTKVSSLCIAYTPIDDSALGFLRAWPQLNSLDLRETNVSDTGMKVLSQLPALQTLNLADTRVTDAGLEHLIGLKSLRSLSAKGTGVTDAGIKALIEANPQLSVVW